METNQTKPSLLRKSLLAGFLVAVSGYSMQASALPLEPFSFHQSSGFRVDATLVGTGGNNIGWYQLPSVPTPPAGTFNTLAWGVPVTTTGRGLLTDNPFTPVPAGNPDTDLSGLRVIGHAGTITTGAALGSGSDWGNWESISTVFHQNRAINVTADTLLNAVIQSVLTLDHRPTVPTGDFPGGDFLTNPNAVAITLNETFNGLPCSFGNPNASICDDLFTFALGTFAPVGFAFEGHNYEVQFRLGNFSDSSSNFPDCPLGNCTIWTAENVTSSLDVQAQIRQLPEPGSLALLSLGLLGLGFAKRRQLNG